MNSNIRFNHFIQNTIAEVKLNEHKKLKYYISNHRNECYLKTY